MTTSGQIALTSDELEKFRKELIEAKDTCIKESKITWQHEIEWLDDILVALQQKDISFDEMIIPMHNLISIVPEEQYRFLPNLRKLFRNLPSDVLSKKDVTYVWQRLESIKENEVNCKANQLFDLSQYWSAYRKFLYMYGIFDNSKQTKYQKELHKELLRVAVETAVKRTSAVKNSDTFITKKDKKDGAN